jgi:hypothetical protein
MKRFRDFIKEESEITMADLNMEFINTALKISTFNVEAGEFTSLRHKKEIQYLFNMHYFPRFDLSKTINVVDKTKLNTLISMLKKENMLMFKKLHKYSVVGSGPGEVTCYFLINNVTLGGGQSAGRDVIIGSTAYEAKAVKVSPDRTAYGFRLGGTFSLDEIKMDLNKLRIKSNSGGTASEISVNKLKDMQQKYPAEYNAIEAKFAKLSYDNYFSKHEVIFINNNGDTPKVGNIEAIKKVMPNEIFIHEVTSGTIKPKVKL